VQWDPKTDTRIAAPYDITEVLDKKKENKRALQEELGLEVDDGKFVIGLISRLTNQKGLDLVNEILPGLIDGNTQIAVLGTGDAVYEGSFRNFENWYKGSVCSCIMYDEGRAHRIYAGSDALLVPSLFEPCGLTQLIAMHYGTVPVVRETGGLKDTVTPYNEYTGEGNGFSFANINAHEFLFVTKYAADLYRHHKDVWNKLIETGMKGDYSWKKSAGEYAGLYSLITGIPRAEPEPEKAPAKEAKKESAKKAEEPAEKKPAEKKPEAKKAPAKKAAAKKPAAKKPAAAKPAKPAPEKAAEKKPDDKEKKD
jgi:starch synthase